MLSTLDQALARAEEALVAVLLAGMVALTFAQVVLRYGFNAGWVWSQEATTTLFGALLMVGMSYAMRVRAHMHVNALVAALPRPGRRAAALLAAALCLAYVGLMGWGAVALVERLQRLGTNARDLPVPRWLLMSMLPAGFGLLGLRIAQLARRVANGELDSLGQAHGAGARAPALMERGAP